MLNFPIKGFIYLLKRQSDINNEYIYIGSTKNLKSRFSSHKTAIRTTKTTDCKSKKTKYFKEHNDDIICEILEEIYYINKLEMLYKEAEYIHSLKPVLNTQKPPLNEEMRKQILNNKAKEYYYNNRDAVLIRQKNKYHNDKMIISGEMMTI